MTDNRNPPALGEEQTELWPPILEPAFVGFTFERREIVDWFVNPQGTRTSARCTVRDRGGR